MKTSTASGVAVLLVLSTVLVSLAGTVEAAPPAGWTSPVQIETTGTYANDPTDIHVAAAGGGRALAAWTQYSTDLGSNVVMWTMYAPDGGWSTPTAIQGGWGDASQPAVAGWPNGSFELVYRDTYLGSYSIKARHWEPGNGWSGFGTVTTDTTATDVSNPALATDPQGNAICVWLSYDGVRWNVRANRFVPATGWGAVNGTLEASDFTASAPLRVALSRAGDAVAVWRQSDGTAVSAYANRYVVGSGWGSATLLESSSQIVYSPALAVDENGNAFALWQQYNGTRDAIFANHFAVGTGWGGANQISLAGSGPSYYAAVAAVPGGGFVAAWTQGNGSRQNAYLNTWTGSAWGAAQNLTTSWGFNSYNMVAAADGAGNVLLVWSHTTPDDFYAVASAWWSESMGLAAVGARLDTAPWGTEAPVVAAADDGGAVALWPQSNGITSHLFAANYWPPDTTAPELSLTAPATGSTSTNATVWVTGTTEPGSEVIVGGIRADVNDSGGFSVPVALTPGANTITVEAADAAGNEAYATVTVTYSDPVPGLQSQLATAQSNLATTQGNLATTQANLATTQSSLTAAQASLTATQGDLAAARLEMTTTKAAQNATDASQTASINAAASTAGTATLFGILGIVIGLAGIGMGFMMSRKAMGGGKPAETKPAEPPK